MAKKFSLEADLEVSVKEAKPNLKPMEVVFNGDKFKVDLHKELQIDPHNLIDSMTQHSANYGWWAAVLATCRAKLRRKKSEYNQKASSLDLIIREQLLDKGLKITEAAVQAAIESSPELEVIARDDMLPLEDFVEMSELMLKAFENKRDMLKEISRAQTSDRINS